MPLASESSIQTDELSFREDLLPIENFDTGPNPKVDRKINLTEAMPRGRVFGVVETLVLPFPSDKFGPAIRFLLTQGAVVPQISGWPGLFQIAKF